MPIYEYFCTACQRSFEDMPKYEDRDAAECKTCSQKTTVVRKLSAPSGFRNYDGGFYRGNTKLEL
jgi:putative FmdB family regulatory protein